MSPFERLGGEPIVRAMTDTLVHRMTTDTMIGFFFRKVDLQRLQLLEYQHAAEFLGASVTYQGRPLEKAHGRHAIMGGHFDRRLQILREVLQDFEVPPDVAQAWLKHQEEQRLRVVNLGAPTSCA